MSRSKAQRSPIIRLLSARHDGEFRDRSSAALIRSRCDGFGPNWIELERKVSYDVAVLLTYIVKNTRVASVRARMEENSRSSLEPKSKFYWYDFSVRGQRFRGSTQETKSTKAAKVASLKLARAVDGLDPVPVRLLC